MKKLTWFEEKLAKFANDAEYLTEKKILEFNEIIVSRMKKLDMSRSQLAERLGVSKPLVTKLLNGNQNLTIKRMVSIAQSLDCKLDLDLCPKGFEVKKFYHVKKVTANSSNAPMKTITSISPKNLNEDEYASAA